MKQRDGSYLTQDELFIAADPDTIYNVLVDFNHRHLWWKTNRAELLNGEEAKEGAQVAIYGRFPIRFLMRIQKLESPHLIRLDVEKGPIRGLCEWQIEPRGKGSAVRLVWNGVRPKGLLARSLFTLVGDRAHRRQAARGLAGLKTYLEVA